MLLTGHGFAPPAPTPGLGRARPRGDADGRTARSSAVLYYRAHHVAGNTGVRRDALPRRSRRAGGRPLPVFCASLRAADPELLAALGRADALVVTVLAAGGTRPADAAAGGDDDAWDVGALAALDVPILQGLCLTSSREAWAASDDGLSPLDAATQVAIPEFDGRLITVPFSFKEIDADGLTALRRRPRARRPGGRHRGAARPAAAHPAGRAARIAVMLSAYPTKHARIGNAVGLDTPASAVRLLRAHARARLRHRPGRRPGRPARASDAGRTATR